MKKGKLLKNVGIFSLLPLFLRDSDAVAFWWHQAELGAITCQVNFLTRYHLQRHLIKLVGLFFPSHMTCVSNRLWFHLIDWLIESKYSCARSCLWLKFSIIKQLQKVLRLLVVKIWFEMDKIDFFYWLLIFHIYYIDLELRCSVFAPWDISDWPPEASSVDSVIYRRYTPLI